MAAEIVDRVQQFYAGIKRVTASFRQAVTNFTFGTTKTSDGTVWITKPSKMRWDYLESASGTDVAMRSQSSRGGPSLYSAYGSCALGSTLTIMVELR